MALFTGFSEGWEVLKDAFKLFFKKPVFLVPLFLCWILVAGTVLYLRYYWVGPDDLTLFLLSVFLFIFFLSYIICFSNVVMLELMQQVEKGEQTSLMRALKETLAKDMVKIVPIAAAWAIVWFIIVLIRALTSKKKGRSEKRPEPSLEDAAMTLGGANSGPFSWLKLGLRMIEKLVRMTIFLTLPAIAWEGKDPFESFGTAASVIKRHPAQFLTTYTITGIIGAIMALPLVPLAFLPDEVDLPSVFWLAVIIYEGIIWTFGIYMEQMSVGLLYLWHLKWVKAKMADETLGDDLSFVAQPQLLDEVHELGDNTNQ